MFNTEALKLSIKRINQLGYFKPMEKAPEIQPTPGADNKVDVTFKIEEQNRNQFTFGGGVSGLEGTFLNASFSTTNFLGAGETFQASAQTGKRTAELPALGERALLPRPPDHRRGRHLHAEDHVQQLRQRHGLHAGQHRPQPGGRLRGRAVVAGVPELHLRDHQDLGGGDRPERPVLPDSTASDGLTGYGASLRPAALRPGRHPPREPAHAELRLQHRRQPVLAALGDAPHAELPADGRPAGRHDQLLPAERRDRRLPAGGQADGARPARRGGVDQALRRTPRTCCRTTTATSSEARPRSAAIRSGRSGRSTPRGARIGGNKFLLFNAEYYFDVYGPLRHAAVLRRRPGVLRGRAR